MTLETKKMLSEMAKFKSAVDRLVLDQLIPKESEIPEVRLLYKMMRDYPSRPAKGMRPFICVTSCKAFGGQEEDVMLTAACIEIFQNWILIHDDIEDASEMRRGLPALHRMYDWTLALNAGDALHALMWGVLLRNKERLGPTKTLAVMEEFSTMVSKTTEGQHIELGWVVADRWDLNEADYIDMCTKKTSWYTAISPLRLGGIVAGADPRSLALMVEAGRKLGVGFQIHDDVLNLTGDSKYGKEIADDLLEGKRTLILIHLLSECSPSERREVARIFRLPREERRQKVGHVMELIKTYDAIAYAKEASISMVEDARAILARARWKSKDAAECINSIARFSVERDW
jgi:geranylgeranyl diphosphate synthase, type II